MLLYERAISPLLRQHSQCVPPGDALLFLLLLLAQQSCRDERLPKWFYPGERQTWGGVLIAYQDVGWIHLAQDTVQWWALLNTVMNLRAP